ncbi:eukaryotic aspartyl protease family protein [Tanacetum coccineum]
MSGASHFSKKSGLIDADISNNFGEYLTSIDIGSPPVKVLEIADTGSDLTWAQCEPCENCYEQVGPILVPSNSFTYQPLSCQARGCDALPESQHSYVQEGNIIIDSGTTLTFFDQELYEELTLDLIEVLGSPTALDPDGFFEYCYKDLNMDIVPTVTFRFTDADVELPPVNTFLEVQKGMSYLTIIPSTDIAIFGNLS